MDVPVCCSRVVMSGVFGFSFGSAEDGDNKAKSCCSCASGGAADGGDCCARSGGMANTRAARTPAWGRRKMQGYRRIIMGLYQLICHPPSPTPVEARTDSASVANCVSLPPWPSKRRPWPQAPRPWPFPGPPMSGVAAWIFPSVPGSWSRAD